MVFIMLLTTAPLVFFSIKKCFYNFILFGWLLYKKKKYVLVYDSKICLFVLKYIINLTKSSANIVYKYIK